MAALQRGSVEGEDFTLGETGRQLAVRRGKGRDGNGDQLSIDKDLCGAVGADAVHGAKASAVRGNQHLSLGTDDRPG